MAMKVWMPLLAHGIVIVVLVLLLLHVDVASEGPVMMPTTLNIHPFIRLTA